MFNDGGRVQMWQRRLLLIRLVECVLNNMAAPEYRVFHAYNWCHLDYGAAAIHAVLLENTNSGGHFSLRILFRFFEELSKKTVP